MQEKLRSLYRKNPNNKLPSFLEEEQGYQSMENSYINLAIIDLKAQQEKEARLLTSSNGIAQGIDTELDSPEDNIDESNTIDVEKLFLNSGNKKKDKGKEKVGISSNDNDEIKEVEKIEEQEEQLSKIHQKILIHGKAGIGKTTLMKYITYQWAQDKLWNQFEYVFLLPLRKLNNYNNKKYKLEGFIYECCLDNELTAAGQKQAITEISKILSSDQKILLLLDGYDEFVPKEENKDFVQSILEAVLNHSKLRVIMTSRPNMVENRHKELFDCQLVNIGFNNENINDYIEKNFKGKKEEKENLYKLIRENRAIQGMCHTPINLHLLCLVWVDLLNEKQGKINSQDFSTTSLYVGIVDWLIRRYAIKTGNKKLVNAKNLKHEQIAKDYEEILKIHEKIAFEGLKQGKAVLEKGLLSKLEVTDIEYEQIQRIGLLKAIDGNELEDNSSNSKGKEKSAIEIIGKIDKEHYFIHLTFQEYMAARCLVRMLNGGNEYQVKEAVEFLDNNKYVQRYERMICFISGIVSLNNKQDTKPSQALLHFWNVMINGRVDLSILKQLSLIIKCMDENGIDETIPDIGNIGGYLRSTIITIREARGKRALGKISERIEEWLGIAQTDQELNNEQEIRRLMVKLKSEDDEEKIEAIEALKEIEIEELSQTNQGQIVEVLLKVFGDSEDELYSKVEERLNELVRRIKDEELKRQINDELVKKEIREGELRTEIEEWVKLGKLRSKNINDLIEEIKNKILIIDVLLPMLKDNNAYVRLRAAKILEKFNSNPEIQKEIVVAVLPLLQSNNIDVHTSAAKLLSRLRITYPKIQKEMVRALVPLLENHDANVLIRGAKLLGHLQITDAKIQTQMVTDLISLIQIWHGNITSDKAKISKHFTVIDLIKGKQLVNDNVAINALKALSKLKITNSQVQTMMINVLIPLLNSWYSFGNDVGNSAAETLNKLNIIDPQVQITMVKALMPLLNGIWPGVRINAAKALGSIKANNSEIQAQIIDMLIPSLQSWYNDCITVSNYVALALANLNTGNTQILSQLISKLMPFLQDENIKIRKSTIEALSNIKTTDLQVQEQMMLALVPLLKDEGWSIRIKATQALGNLTKDGQLQRQMIDELMPLLESKIDHARISAAEVLGMLNITNSQLQRQIVDKLMPLLKNKSINVRRSAAEALGILNIVDLEVEVRTVKALIILLKDKDEYVRSKATQALSKSNITSIHLQAQMVVALVPLLKDENQQTYDQATSILINLNTTNIYLQKILIKELLSLFNDQDRNINIITLTNIIEVLSNLKVDCNQIDLQPLAAKLTTIMLDLIEDQSESIDSGVDRMKLKIAHILSKIQFKDFAILRDIVLGLAKQQDRLQATTLLNIYTEQLLLGNISIPLTSETLSLISLPLFRQAAVMVDEDKVVINYRGYRREMPFAGGEDKADMAYKVFSYFYQQHQLSGMATTLLDYRLNFSKAIQISGLDIELGSMTLANSKLQEHNHSFVNSAIRLTCQQWMISVVRRDRSVCNNARHVFMMIESRNIFHEAKLYRLELLQPDAVKFPKRGRIEITEEAHLDVSKQEELARVFQIVLGNTHYNGNNGFRVDQDYYHKSCLVTREIAMQIIHQAKAEKAKAAEVVYDFYGIKAPNCFTWARKKLRENLEAKQYERLEIEKAGERYADPLSYLGPTANSTWAWMSHNIQDGTAVIGKVFGGK